MQHIRMPLPHEREPLERRLPYLKPDVMDFLKVCLACSLQTSNTYIRRATLSLSVLSECCTPPVQDV